MLATEPQSAQSTDSNDLLTKQIIGCAISVHKALGPGLLESVYEAALAEEFSAQGIAFEKQKVLPVYYRDKEIGDFRIDLLVENQVVLELKSVERHEPLFEAQLLTYLKLGGYHRGLIINFNTQLLKQGIKRMVV